MSLEQRIEEKLKQFDEECVTYPVIGTQDLVTQTKQPELVRDFIKQALTSIAEEAREEERKKIPVGYLRQYLNERTPKEMQKLLTNEDIMRFINLGYKALNLK